MAAGAGRRKRHSPAVRVTIGALPALKACIPGIALLRQIEEQALFRQSFLPGSHLYLVPTGITNQPLVMRIPTGLQGAALRAGQKVTFLKCSV